MRGTPNLGPNLIVSRFRAMSYSPQSTDVHMSNSVSLNSVFIAVHTLAIFGILLICANNNYESESKTEFIIMCMSSVFMRFA